MKSFQKPSRKAAVVACAAGIAVIGALGAGTVAFAASSPSPSPTSSASGSSSTPAPGSTDGPTNGPTAPTGGPDGGPAGRTHEPHIGGEVLSLTDDSLQVTDHDGFTRTIVVGDDVTVTEDGASSSVSDIEVGDHIEATGSVDANGTSLDATEITIGAPTPPAGGPGRDGAPKPPIGDGTGPQGAPTPPTDGGTRLEVTN